MIKIRGATLIHGSPCALQDTGISPAGNVCRKRRSLLSVTGTLFGAPSADHFNNVYLTRLSAPRALCGGITAFISASSVYYGIAIESTTRRPGCQQIRVSFVTGTRTGCLQPDQIIDLLRTGEAELSEKSGSV